MNTNYLRVVFSAESLQLWARGREQERNVRKGECWRWRLFPQACINHFYLCVMFTFDSNKHAPHLVVLSLKRLTSGVFMFKNFLQQFGSCCRPSLAAEWVWARHQSFYFLKIFTRFVPTSLHISPPSAFSTGLMKTQLQWKKFGFYVFIYWWNQ